MITCSYLHRARAVTISSISLLRLLTVPLLTMSLPTTRLVQKVSSTRFRLRLTSPPGGLNAHVRTSTLALTESSTVVVQSDVHLMRADKCSDGAAAHFLVLLGNEKVRGGGGGRGRCGRQEWEGDPRHVIVQ